MKLKTVFWVLIAVVLLICWQLLRLHLQAKTVTVSMLWQCGIPEHFGISDFVKNDPAAKPVTLRFARYPNIVDIQAQPGLCDALKAAGKPVIPVVILPIGEPGRKIDGYNILFVNGYRVGSPYALENGNLGGYAPPLEELLR